MPIQNLKPLIGIKRDEPLDFKNLTDDQEGRISVAAGCWSVAAGLLVTAFIHHSDPQYLENVQQKTEQGQCYVRGPFGTGGWTNCR